MSELDLGSIRFRFPRVMSARNWRFVLLIAALALLPALLVDLRPLGRVGVFLAIMAVPFVITGGPWVLQKLGVLRRVEAVLDGGLLVSVGFRTETYPWRSLFVERYVEGTTRGLTQRVLALRGRTGDAVAERWFDLQSGVHGVDAIAFVAERLGNPPLELL